MVAVGALVELILDADSIWPRDGIHLPCLVESVAVAIEHEGIVPILRGTDALHVPLDMMPGVGCPARTSDAVFDPAVVGAVPGIPVAIAKIALTADHELFAAKGLPQIELR